MNPDEDYFVVRIVEGAKQLEESETYSAVKFKKNDWIISVQWYNFEPSKKNRRGDRFYTRGDEQWIPCGSIIRTLKMPITLRWVGRHFQLSCELNKHIDDRGDLTY